MLIDFVYLYNKYNITFRGVLHIGGHECEEIKLYEYFLPRNKILWIEAMKDKVELCKNRYPELLIENAVVSNKKEIVKFNISNNGQSSSFLELEKHKIHHPHIYYTSSYITETIETRDILSKYDIDFNFINLDIQGAELKALQGMEEYLHKIDYIYTEVNNDYVYKDCALIGEIDDFLSKYNFIRVETMWCENYNWGDAFYIKKAI